MRYVCVVCFSVLCVCNMCHFPPDGAGLGVIGLEGDLVDVLLIH